MSADGQEDDWLTLKRSQARQVFEKRLHPSDGDRGFAAPSLKRNPVGLSFKNPRPGLSIPYPSARALASASISLLKASSADFTRVFTAGSSVALATFSLAKR